MLAVAELVEALVVHVDDRPTAAVLAVLEGHRHRALAVDGHGQAGLQKHTQGRGDDDPRFIVGPQISEHHLQQHHILWHRRDKLLDETGFLGAIRALDALAAPHRVGGRRLLAGACHRFAGGRRGHILALS